MKGNSTNFTRGPIFVPLIKFAMPILASLFLQAMYGAVDLIVVGQFCDTANISGVSTGSQFMNGVLSILYGFAVAITVIMGQKLGKNDIPAVFKTIASGVALFAVLGVILTIVIVGFTESMTRIMNTPAEAHDETYNYIKICGSGVFFILAYNLLGSIFRGLGDSKTPLVTVAIATVINIGGDLFAVAYLGMGAEGAAIATVAAQLISVIISLAIISRRDYGELGFSPRNRKSADTRAADTQSVDAQSADAQSAYTQSAGTQSADAQSANTQRTKASFTPARKYILKIVKVGFPLALQDTLVTLSFLVIIIIVNSLGVTASAAAGVGGKICNIIMLVSSACSSTLSAFTAQNVGAGEHARARRALVYLMGCAFAFSAVIAYTAFFHGDILVSLFTKDADVIAMAWDYLKAYSIDTLLTCFLFCFIGYYSGYGRTRFVMLQGIIGAFGVRIPVAYLMSKAAEPTLFKVALATPMSSAVQIALCVVYYFTLRNKLARKAEMKL